MWLGGTYSVRKFVDVFLQHKIAQQIVMFSGGPIYLDHTAGYTAEHWCEWIVTRLNDQTAVARRAYDEKLQAAKRSRKAQLEADARRQQSQQWQSRGSLALSAHFVFRHVNRYPRNTAPLRGGHYFAKTQKNSTLWILTVAQQQLRTFAAA